MKRLMISIILIIATLTGSCLAIAAINKGNREIFAAADEIKAAVNSGKDAAAQVDELCRLWEKYSVRMSCIENANYLNSIASSVYRLRSMNDNSTEDFFAELDSICGQINELYQKQLPYLHVIA